MAFALDNRDSQSKHKCKASNKYCFLPLFGTILQLQNNLFSRYNHFC